MVAVVGFRSVLNQHERDINFVYSTIILHYDAFKTIIENILTLVPNCLISSSRNGFSGKVIRGQSILPVSRNRGNVSRRQLADSVYAWTLGASGS